MTLENWGGGGGGATMKEQPWVSGRLSFVLFWGQPRKLTSSDPPCTLYVRRKDKIDTSPHTGRADSQVFQNRTHPTPKSWQVHWLQIYSYLIRTGNFSNRNLYRISGVQVSTQLNCKWLQIWTPSLPSCPLRNPDTWTRQGSFLESIWIKQWSKWSLDTGRWISQIHRRQFCLHAESAKSGQIEAIDLE